MINPVYSYTLFKKDDKMAIKIILVRHGETIWNKQRRCQGFSDIPLNDAGKEQAVLLGRALRSVPLSAVYSSDLVRAKKTGDLIAEHHKIKVVTDARFRELNQGDLEGSSLGDLLADHPALLKKWLENPADVKMPGGESMRALQKRAVKALQNVIENHPDETVCVVAHNLCILSIICDSIKLDLDNFRKLKMDNASVSVLEHSRAGFSLISMNDTHHLDKNLRK